MPDQVLALAAQAAQSVSDPSFMEESFNSIGKGFCEVMDDIERMNATGSLTSMDALKIQQSMFHYTIYQETVTKIVSKAATAVNEVMKAQ